MELVRRLAERLRPRETMGEVFLQAAERMFDDKGEVVFPDSLDPEMTAVADKMGKLPKKGKRLGRVIFGRGEDWDVDRGYFGEIGVEMEVDFLGEPADFTVRRERTMVSLDVRNGNGRACLMYSEDPDSGEEILTLMVVDQFRAQYALFDYRNQERKWVMQGEPKTLPRNEPVGLYGDI